MKLVVKYKLLKYADNEKQSQLENKFNLELNLFLGHFSSYPSVFVKKFQNYNPFIIPSLSSSHCQFIIIFIPIEIYLLIFSFRIEIILECRIRAHQDTATGVSKIDIILITGMIEIETMTVGFTIKVSNIAQINLQNTKVS